MEAEKEPITHAPSTPEQSSLEGPDGNYPTHTPEVQQESPAEAVPQDDPGNGNTSPEEVKSVTVIDEQESNPAPACHAATTDERAGKKDRCTPQVHRPPYSSTFWDHSL